MGHHVLKSFDGVQYFDTLGVRVVSHLEVSGHSSGYPPPTKKMFHFIIFPVKSNNATFTLLKLPMHIAEKYYVIEKN